jgi:7-carboxy-7-deazaguanine synthase
MDLDAIADRVAQLQAHHVTVTGGEPLAQRPCTELLTKLCDAGYEVSLETSGAVDIARVDPRVRIVMDVKTPGSGEVDRNRFDNLSKLKSSDEIKFVICDRADYEWSRDFVRRERLAERVEVLFSPVWGQIEPRALAEWILADRTPVRLQLQLHKLLWGEERGR